MKVSDLIRQLLNERGNRNPEDVEVILLQYNNGPDWADENQPIVDSRGGNDYPFTVLIK